MLKIEGDFYFLYHGMKKNYIMMKNLPCHMRMSFPNDETLLSGQLSGRTCAYL